MRNSLGPESRDGFKEKTQGVFSSTPCEGIPAQETYGFLPPLPFPPPGGGLVG